VQQRLALKLINAISASAWLTAKMRVRLWRAAGARIGDVVDVRSGCWMNTAKLTVGDRAFINAGLTIDGTEHVFIGRNCWLAVNVTLLTTTHQIGGPSRRAGAETNAPIVIGDGCWLGANVTVLPGVTIGSGCVVGAGSVVTKDLEADGLYVGVPARFVRRLESEADRRTAAGSRGPGSNGVPAQFDRRAAAHPV
jgi:maltose O-acetyltransferase